MPMLKPIKISALVCACKYRRALETKPVKRVIKLMAKVRLIAKCILRLKRNVNRLPKPNKCILLFILKKRSNRVDIAAIISPRK